MELEAVDYSEDPSPDKSIFGNPSFASRSWFAPSSSSTASDLPQHPPSISLAVHQTIPTSAGTYPIESPPFEVPPLSPGSLHFLATHTPPSPSFDPLAPSFLTVPSHPPSVPLASHPTVSGVRPSGCFESPAVTVRPAKPSSLDGITNPLVDHHRHLAPARRRSNVLGLQQRTSPSNSTNRSLSVNTWTLRTLCW